MNITATPPAKRLASTGLCDLSAQGQVTAEPDWLQTAGDEGWESAKASYDKTTRDLASAWRKLEHRE